MKYTFEVDVYSEPLLKKIDKLNVEAASYGCGAVSVEEVKKALAIAKFYHDGQFRKSGLPYFSHPVAVAIMVAGYLFKTDVIIAAILHDCVEDTTLTYDIIRNEFGVRVEEMVYRLTRIRDGKKISVGEIIEESRAHGDDEVLIIKQFDRAHNMQTIDAMKPEKQKEIAEETLKEIAMIAVEMDNIYLEEYICMTSYKIIANKQDFDFYYQKYHLFSSSQDYCLSFPTFENT